MKIRDIILGLLFAMIWSSAFTSARIAMFDAPPFLLLSLRFLLSGTIAMVIAYFLGQSISFSKPEWYAICIFGLCQNTVYLGLNFVAMQWIDASLAAIIASLLPLIVTIFSWFFLKDRLSKVGLSGLLIGLFGVIFIMNAGTTSKLNTIGIIFCLCGVVALAIATIIVRHSSGKNLLMMIGLQMIVGSITLFPLSVAFETWEVTWSFRLLAVFLYTTIFPGLVATVIWFKLLHFIGPIKAAAFHFLNPFFGVLIAHLILSEKLVSQQIIGVLLVMAAILILQISSISKTVK
jgi:drug/metabolite transporter (DMT)-like permease